MDCLEGMDATAHCDLVHVREADLLLFGEHYHRKLHPGFLQLGQHVLHLVNMAKAVRAATEQKKMGHRRLNGQQRASRDETISPSRSTRRRESRIRSHAEQPGSSPALARNAHGLCCATVCKHRQHA